MFEFLQTFNRVALAFLSGALLMVGTTFWADKFSGGLAFKEVADMLTKVDDFRIIFTVITALTAYVIGTINFAASCVAFGYLEKTSQDEVMLVSQIESLQQPQVLKETLELLHVKRTLVVFIFPLVWFGAALAWDTYENYFTDGVRIGAGTALVALAILAYVFAVRMTRLLNTTARRLLADVPNKTPDPPNYDL